MNRIAMIGTAGVPANYGGFETLVHNLIKELNGEDDRQKTDFDLHVYCSSRGYSKNQMKPEFNRAKLHYLPFSANGVQSVIYDIVSILHAITYANTLLILGVPGCIILPFVRLFTNKRIIVNIDGLEWKRAKWNKVAKLFLKFSEFMAVKFAHTVIADNRAIQEHVFNSYGESAKLIAYGADHASPEKLTYKDLQKFPFLKFSYAFKVCRIEPENNIHIVLKAFSELPSKHLVVIGNWNASKYGEQMREIYGSFPNIHLMDPIYDQKTLDRIRSNCYVYVHGHSAGGTNPSLVEAMYLGLPVIAFGVNYNRYTTEERAMYFQNHDELKRLIVNTPYLQYVTIGDALQRIARSRYTWKVISQKYAQCFNMALNPAASKTILGKGERMPWLTSTS